MPPYSVVDVSFAVEINGSLSVQAFELSCHFYYPPSLSPRECQHAGYLIAWKTAALKEKLCGSFNQIRISAWAAHANWSTEPVLHVRLSSGARTSFISQSFPSLLRPRVDKTRCCLSPSVSPGYLTFLYSGTALRQIFLFAIKKRGVAFQNTWC